MSVKVLSRVWTRSAQKGNSLLLALALADIADDEGYAWPSVPTLARKTRLSKRTTQRLLRCLEVSREITVTKGGGIVGTHGGPQRTHLYRVMVGLEGGDKMTPPSRLRGGDKKAQGGVIRGQGGDMAVSSEPSVDPSVETSKNGTLLTNEEQRKKFGRLARMAATAAKEGVR